MDCFKDLIGIRGCDEDAGKKFYINDLPGMSLKLADSGSNEEVQSGIELINNKISFASDYIANDVRNYLHGKFIFESILDSETVGYFKSDYSSLLNGKSGIKISIREKRFLKFNISKIHVLLEDDLTDDKIYIYNLRTGQLLKEITYDSMAGSIIEIDCDFDISTNGQKTDLFICRDSTTIKGIEATAYNTEKGCMSCGNSSSICSVYAGYINTGDNISNSNFNTSSTARGISVDYSITCSVDDYVCSLKQLLAWAILFKTGSMIVQEVINNKSLYNTIVIIHKDDNKELLEYYEQEYIKAITQITQSLKMPHGSCFDCTPKVKNVIQIPS